MIENYNKVICDSCGVEYLSSVGELLRGWRYTDTYGDLCPACLTRLRNFFRDFYGDETECFKRIFDEIGRGI